MNRTIAISSGIVFVLATVSIYLGVELAGARAATQDATARAQALEVRITALEAGRLARASGFGSAARQPGGISTSALVPAAPVPATLESPVVTSGASASPVMRRYQRVQARSSARRLYADFANEQGLSEDEAKALFDLLAAHEIASSSVVDHLQAGEVARDHERDLAEAARNLLGATRANELETYRQTLMLRFEISALADQLEGADAPLTDEQRRSFLRSISDGSQLERPTFAPGQSLEEAQRTYSDWQESQAVRFASLVRSTLTADQLKHYDDFESARREMSGGN